MMKEMLAFAQQAQQDGQGLYNWSRGMLRDMGTEEARAVLLVLQRLLAQVGCIRILSHVNTCIDPIATPRDYCRRCAGCALLQC